MEKLPRPAEFKDLKMVIESLNNYKIDYLLIGAFSLYAHGIIRATTDIDIMFPATKEVGEKVKKALMVLPDKCAKEIDPIWFEEGAVIRVADEFVVDLMFRAGGQNYEALKKYQEIIEVDGIPVKTVNLEGLLLTKQQSTRDKDIADRKIIQEALKELEKAKENTKNE